jgi:hypothetical protein
MLSCIDSCLVGPWRLSGVFGGRGNCGGEGGVTIDRAFSPFHLPVCLPGASPQAGMNPGLWPLLESLESWNELFVA